MMRPQRISSEAPEVVPTQLDLITASSRANVDRLKRKKDTQYEKQVVEHHSPGFGNQSPIAGDGGGYETPASVSNPRGTEREYQTPGTVYDFSSHGVEVAGERPHQSRRVGVVTTILLLILAFIIGVGVGGGIGGAIAAINKHKSSSDGSSNTNAPTPTTTSAPPSTTTMIVDVAGCPNINNATYSSTVTPYTFLQACSTDIEAPSGQSIDVANKTETSFDACLDWCAQYTVNPATKGQCIAATWVIFSAADPTRNSRCYLKNSTGVAKPLSSGQQVVSGYLNTA